MGCQPEQQSQYGDLATGCLLPLMIQQFIET